MPPGAMPILSSTGSVYLMMGGQADHQRDAGMGAWQAFAIPALGHAWVA
jgi:hypothetical protein